MTIEQRQCLLRYLGYAPGAVDGIWGERSEAAMARFRKAEGLPQGENPEAALLTAVAQGRFCREADFWQGIQYFTRAEFKCKCGGQYCDGYPAEMQEAVVKIADAARAHFGRPAHVISGLRCQKWNAHEGGVDNSQHMFGEAVDLKIDGVPAETLRKFVAAQPGHRWSYCINSTNVHFDIPKIGR